MTTLEQGLRRRLSPEERQAVEAECAQAARENRRPYARQVPVIPEAESPSSVEPATGRRILKRADLVHSMAARGEWYEVPGMEGGWYVFGLSDADYRLLYRWANEEGGGDAIETARAALVHQVIVCCRQGDTLQSEPVFSKADAEYISKYLGFAVVNEIVSISNRLSGNDETLGAGSRRFFAHIRTCLRTWCSTSKDWDACPSGLREKSTQLESLVSRALSRGNLDSASLDELKDL